MTETLMIKVSRRNQEPFTPYDIVALKRQAGYMSGTLSVKNCKGRPKSVECQVKYSPSYISKYKINDHDILAKFMATLNNLHADYIVSEPHTESRKPGARK